MESDNKREVEYHLGIEEGREERQSQQYFEGFYGKQG